MNLPTRRNFLCASGVAVGSLIVGCSTVRSTHGPPLRSRAWGAFLPEVTVSAAASGSPIEQLDALAGSQVAYLHRFCAVGDTLPVAELNAIMDVGATPIITLELWRPTDGSDQPLFSLQRLRAGAWDADIRRWGAELARWGQPTLLRLAQEMNGTWYPWSIGMNGNSPGDYKAAWARIHAIISSQASNVKFVWAPNATTEGTTDFTSCFPGHELVDCLGLDGYNWGSTTGHQWQSANKLFSRSIATLDSLAADLPILVTEVGCAEGTQPGLKAEWIRDFFTVIEANDRVSGFVWFQMDKERDWRFNSSPASTAAFREGLSQWMNR